LNPEPWTRPEIAHPQNPESENPECHTCQFTPDHLILSRDNCPTDEQKFGLTSFSFKLSIIS